MARLLFRFCPVGQQACALSGQPCSVMTAVTRTLRRNGERRLSRLLGGGRAAPESAAATAAALIGRDGIGFLRFSSRIPLTHASSEATIFRQESLLRTLRRNERPLWELATASEATIFCQGSLLHTLRRNERRELATARSTCSLRSHKLATARY